MEALAQRRSLQAKLADYWYLIKFRQTALLLITGFCSYALAQGLPLDPLEAVGMAIGLLFSISGCTVLNMLSDRDVDAQMGRTTDRPLAAGRMRPFEALAFGVGLLAHRVMACPPSPASHSATGMVAWSARLIARLCRPQIWTQCPILPGICSRWIATPTCSPPSIRLTVPACPS